ncbi:hypothetical protein PDL71_05095 [Lacibacter sp. MH-610]|jgi:hypothetical protein|uniref:hypothetical protein n=1 Tax=Lacibacter sp. MH-610 TaxID=3020883 RepID=UPI0038925A2E
MLAKVKPQVFLDTLKIEVLQETNQLLTAVLRDDKGCICRSADYTSAHTKDFTLNGLNDLPYGVYSLELSHGEEEMQVRLVKRV